MSDLHAALTALVEDWADYGEGTTADRVFGQQILTVDFAVERLRALLEEHQPSEREEWRVIKDGSPIYWGDRKQLALMAAYGNGALKEKRTVRIFEPVYGKWERVR
jgi:hypothetical protein